MSSDTFVREARSGVRRLDEGLLELESEVDQHTVDDLFRTAHNLKSTLGMEGHDRASDLAHAIEDVLEGLRDETLTPDGRTVDRTLAAVDCLDTMLDEIEQHDRIETDPTDEVEALRRLAEDAGTPEANGGSDETATATADRPAAPAESAADPEVEAALDAASEFDDLDALVADMDDPEEMESLEGGGSFDDVLEQTELDTAEADGAADAVAGRDAGDSDGDTDPDPAESPFDEVTSGSAQDPFVWAKSSVDEDASLETLQSEIEAESFGEFDAEDDMTIQELLAVEPDEAASDEADESDATDEPTVESDESDREEPAANPEEPATGPSATELSDAGTSPRARGSRDGDETNALRTVVDALATEGADPDPEAEAGAADSPETGPRAADATTDATDAADADTDTADGADASPDRQGPTTRSDDRPDLLEQARTEDLRSGEPDEADVSAFGRGEGLEAFESRFESLFEGGEQSAPTQAAATIEASALATERFRPRTEPERETDATSDRTVQSLTVDVEYADDLLSLTETLSAETRRLTEEAPSDDAQERADAIASTVRDLQRTVMEIRLMPIETITGRLDRVVRDAARGTDTEAALTVDGADVRVDRSIIDSLRDPLVHLVRNAVDHGIEPVPEREAAGKPATGEVAVRARRRGDKVVVEVSDDGRGLDPEELRAAAVEAGIISRTEAVGLDDAEAYDLVFDAGLSTADEVTGTSGRGVGMDVVRRTAAALDGRVAVESGDGGTTVTLELPVSKAVSELVFVAAGDAEFAVPAADVRRIGRADGGQLTDGLLATAADRTVDLGAEMRVRDGEAEAAPAERRVVSVDTAVGVLGIECDRVVDRREAVVTPYDDVLAEVPAISGATTGTNEQLIHVIDVEEL